jgi:acyl-CoA synthetase (NDP forming)/GNAT superfamily N-acetyltransferase
VDRERARAAPGYPAELEADVLLSDGRVARLFPIAPIDASALERFASALSDETRYMRFFSYRKELTDEELTHLVTVDYVDRLALVAFVEDELAAVARYERLGGGSLEAEVAFTVRDDQQGRGLATVMLEHLASAARARGIFRFIADTLTENRKMLGVFQNAGFDEQAHFESGLIRVTMELEAAPSYVDRVESRDRNAAVASIGRLLAPGSVAVIGASRRPGTVGHELVANIARSGYEGALSVVHPSAPRIAGIGAYRSIEEIGQPVDLVLIAVPASEVAAVVESCGRASAGGVVVITTGFFEGGDEGAVAEQQIVTIARRFGMRVIGPSSMGVVTPRPGVRLNATFAPVSPSAGPVAFCSQSGGLGVAILEEMERRNLGLSSFVSVGDKADVSGNDLIRYWDEDGATKVICLHLESFGNPRHFRQIARRVGRRTPIVAVKSRRSDEFADAAVDALFGQSGVIRVDTLEELFDVAELLGQQPLPAGGRVAILANAGGPSVLAADACAAHGLSLAELSKSTMSSLAIRLSEGTVVSNPVDCVASATPKEYAAGLECLLGDDGVDAVIVIFTPALAVAMDEVGSAIATVAASSHKPVLANFLAFGAGGARAALACPVQETSPGGAPGPGTPAGPSGTVTTRRVPWYAYPESAARALGHVACYVRWLQEPEDAVTAPRGTDVAAARVIVRKLLEGRAGGTGGKESAEIAGGWVGPGDAHSLLGGYGIDVQPSGPSVHAAIEIGVVQEETFGSIVYVSSGGHRSLSLVPVSRREALSMVDHLVEAAGQRQGWEWRHPLAELICRLGALAEDLPEVLEVHLPVTVPSDESLALLIVAPRIRLGPLQEAPGFVRRRLR